VATLIQRIGDLITAIGADMKSKAPLDSPTFTGTVTSPTVQATTTAGVQLRSSVGNIRAILNNTGLFVGNAVVGNAAGALPVLGIQDTTAEPNANPSGGVYVYSFGGVLKVRQSNGTIITIANDTTGGGGAPAAPVALTDGANIATNASLSSHFRVTLGGNRTLDNPTGGTDGQRVLWEITQDGTGGRTLALGNKFRFGTDILNATLSTTPNAKDFLGAIYNSTADLWYVVSFVKGY